MPGALYSSRGNSLVLIKSAQGSSIGSYSTQWMNEFYCSAKGESAESWLDDSRAKRMKLPYPPMKILYPSLRTVKDSVLGEQVRFCLHFPSFADDHFRVVGLCSVEGLSGRQQSFRETSFTTRRANAVESSCIPRYLAPASAVRHV